MDFNLSIVEDLPDKQEIMSSIPEPQDHHKKYQLNVVT